MYSEDSVVKILDESILENSENVEIPFPIPDQ